MGIGYWIEENKKKVLAVIVLLILLVFWIVSLGLSSVQNQMVLNKFAKFQYEYYQDRFDGDLSSNIDLSMAEFRFWLNENYKYNVDTTNCKFYSYIWKSYLDYHNIENVYVMVGDHVFVSAVYDDKHCIYDQNNVMCIGLE